MFLQPSLHKHMHACIREKNFNVILVLPCLKLQNVLQLKTVGPIEKWFSHIKSIVTRPSKLDLMLICSDNFFRLKSYHFWPK